MSFLSAGEREKPKLKTRNGIFLLRHERPSRVSDGEIREHITLGRDRRIRRGVDENPDNRRVHPFPLN